jgi:hypothetical protein
MKQLPLGLHLLLSGLDLVVGQRQLLLARHQLNLHLLLLNHCMAQSRRLGGQFVIVTVREAPVDSSS